MRTRARFAAGHAGDFALLASWFVEDGDVDGAFAVVEGARARALLDELAAGHVDLKTGIEPGGPLTAAALARVPAPESLDPSSPAGLLGRLGRPPVTGHSRPAIERVLHGLWRALVPPAVWARVRDSSQVVLVPDQVVLHRLPFEALVVSRGPGGTRFWLDEGPPVRYGASATALKALDERSRQSANRALVSVADPA